RRRRAPLRSACARSAPPRACRASLFLGIDDTALGQRNLPLLAPQPALRLVEQALHLPVLAGDARRGDARALPDVVMVYLCYRCADPVLELCLRRAQMVALLLQRLRLREVKLAGEDPDPAALHSSTSRSTISAASRTISTSRAFAPPSSDSSTASRLSRPCSAMRRAFAVACSRTTLPSPGSRSRRTRPSFSIVATSLLIVGSVTCSADASCDNDWGPSKTSTDRADRRAGVMPIDWSSATRTRRRRWMGGACVRAARCPSGLELV